MADDWTEILAFTDASGKRLAIGHAIGYVRIAVRSPANVVLNEIVLDAGQRELFMRAFMEAERGAEAAARDGCPIEAVLADGRHPCTRQRDHDGGHAFTAEAPA